MAKHTPQSPFLAGDHVIIKNTTAAKKYGAPGTLGEVLGTTPETTWVMFKRGQGERDAWVPNEHLEAQVKARESSAGEVQPRP
jgi:hypothetical protein